MIMIDKTKITKEILEKAAKCETAEQLIALAKKEGFDITKAEAESYLAELENCELDVLLLLQLIGDILEISNKSNYFPIYNIWLLAGYNLSYTAFYNAFASYIFDASAIVNDLQLVFFEWFRIYMPAHVFVCLSKNLLNRL